MITGNLMMPIEALVGAAEARGVALAEAARATAETKKAEPVKKSDAGDAAKLQREVIKPKAGEKFRGRFESLWVAGHKAM